MSTSERERGGLRLRDLLFMLGGAVLAICPVGVTTLLGGGTEGKSDGESLKVNVSETSTEAFPGDAQSTGSNVPNVITRARR